MLQQAWAFFYSPVANLLCFKMISDPIYTMYHKFTIHFHVYLCFWAQARVKFYGQNADHSKVIILLMYSQLIFICVGTGSRPLNQRFLITHSPLIFVWVKCLAQQLKINHKYTTIKQWLRTKLSQFRNDPLNQCFFNDIFIAYFYVVFASVLVLNQRFLMT